MIRWLAFLLSAIGVLTPYLAAQSAASSSDTANSELRFVLYLSRHGVRSPTGAAAAYNAYSIAPWPEWDVPPGYLTAHGYRLMQIFGGYDRALLSAEGLLSASGCEDAQKVTFYADTDQRTRETAKALAAGMFPGCAPAVQALPEGKSDPLFHPRESRGGSADSALSLAALTGTVGGDADNPTQAYRSQLAELDAILGKCGKPASDRPPRQSLLDIPARFVPAYDGRLAELRGPLSAASTLTENLLLEYTEGMDAANVGRGCVNGANLRSLIDLHTAESEIAQRPLPLARAQAAPLADQIRLALTQAATGYPAAGAISRVSDRALFLVGHDTNIATLAGLLNLHWIADGRRDDTPPGGALVFELWQSRAGHQQSVRFYYTTQTLEQMRAQTALTPQNPPVRVPVFVPGCNGADLSCPLPELARILQGDAGH
jgi:4-phytase/acid phosphatase